MVGPAWEPAGELERELLAARRAGDQATFLERLARAIRGLGL